ncbi:Ehrlichia chaffeensis immunodominant surface protein repeat-containing domain protein [Paragonimus kellicotti]|nr:Ehrlichia chaffeensis immunodominant surface protein repeat-containing domain protein [Paragonimus kellicotti]
MMSEDLQKIAGDPKFAPNKRKPVKKSRSVGQLFEDVDQEVTFKDKRGRPWLKNPKAYARAKVASKQKKKTEQATEAHSQESSAEDVDSDVSETASTKSSDVSMHSSSSLVSDEEDVNPMAAIADLCDADWQELTKDAVPTTTVGRRLALLHFDWDNAKAENIYMVLESFLPARGLIERVTIYPSEFGIKRLAEEAIKGPPELVDNLSDEEQEKKEPVNDHKITKTVSQTDSTKNEHNVPLNPVEVDDKAGWRKASVSTKRRIRQYQLARLKYFYAIIEFDSPETAEAVYDACDGLEYESSGCRFDLRFVNDDEVFSVPPEHAHLVSECREINKAKYAPRSFETAALHSTRIGISWDKTPDERIDWLRDQFKPEADPHITLTEDRQKLEKYLALSSSGASTAASSDVDEPPPAPTVPRIRRHRPKKLPPAELRAALLGATLSDSTPNIKDDDNCPDQNCDPIDTADHEDEEEVLDLNEVDRLTSSDGSIVEDYDLGPVEKKASKTMIKV